MSWIVWTLKAYGLFGALPLALVAAGIYAAARIAYLRFAKKPRGALSAEIARGLLVAYLVVLFVIVWFPELPKLVFGQIPLSEFLALTFARGDYAENFRFFALFKGDFSVLRDEELVGNIVMFVPYGILLAVSFQKLRWWAVDLIGLGTTVTIELVQPFLERSCDLDDIIANTLGAVIGCGIAKLVLTLSRKRE
ncbi:MAG: VanZ family protein [Oscillospiraceae bacterium]|nr:VanZ family protein [Oscillospiraceae bacterium]